LKINGNQEREKKVMETNNNERGIIEGDPRF